ncbi:hypothetical protein DFP73DRAFT_529688 [Morchella snyderi]|nr:hypothetical protein DFP73DRAFT_529688 [Morchella snyderi]
MPTPYNFKYALPPLSVLHTAAITTLASKINERGTPFNASDMQAAMHLLKPWTKEQVFVRLDSLLHKKWRAITPLLRLPPYLASPVAPSDPSCLHNPHPATHPSTPAPLPPAPSGPGAHSGGSARAPAGEFLDVDFLDVAVFFQALGRPGSQDLVNELYKATIGGKPDISRPLAAQLWFWGEQRRRGVSKRSGRKRRRGGGARDVLSLRSRDVGRPGQE